MPIQRGQYERIINTIDVGNSVAEQDSLLEQARVETPIFTGVLGDRYDVVLGRKGAGKTAIFKIINIISPFLLKDSNLIILSGVNSAGEPIFNLFKKDFEKFTETDFENFWKLYFISIIYNNFVNSNQFQAKLLQCAKEVQKFKSECQKAGIPEIAGNQPNEQALAWVMNIFKTRVKNIKVSTQLDPVKGAFLFAPEVEFFDDKKEVSEQKNFYINNIGLALKDLLKASGFKIWIILDRLDEVFDRYSKIEFNGLRGLLRAYKSFDVGQGNDLLRIKIFLRDDILAFLTDSDVFKTFFPEKEITTLAATTHILSKESPTLSWSEDEIEQLILNRLLLNRELRNYLDIPQTKELSVIKDELTIRKNRITYWYRIFPESTSSKWIFTRLKDSNDVVTPRSVIDMLEGALDYQKKKIQTNYEDCTVIFPVDSIKAGLDVASKHKLEKDIYIEFPNEQANIKKLQERRHKLTQKDLEEMYGKEWETVVLNLRRIGILRYVKNSKEYRIEFLFRPALDIAYKH